LCAALLIASVFVALLIGFFGAERRNATDAAAARESDRSFCEQLAERAAPVLGRGDLLRLSMLVAAARELQNARLMLLDASGRVLLDTALVLGDRQLGLLAHSGVFQRQTEVDGTGATETLAPIRMGEEVLGEIRLQSRASAASLSFDFGLCGLAFLCCLSIVAVATVIGHQWTGRVRLATDTLIRLAAGEVGEKRPEAAPGELQELGFALDEMERGVQEGLSQVAQGFTELAFQIVDGLEQRGFVTPGHGERTARFAGVLATRLQLLPDDRRDLELACRLHEIGKAWLRPAILARDAKLSEVEMQSLQQHPARAAEHLGAMPGLRRVAQIIRHQDERYDGKGWPDGLRGDRIPITSRILAIASAFDHLLTQEATQRWQGAMEQLLFRRGEVYDPWLLSLFAEELVKSPPSDPVSKPVLIAGFGGSAAGTGGAPVPRTDEEFDVATEVLDDLEVIVEEIQAEERP
jgi:HD-GYP domain-containing protein (c-di-GMP phosphodiesterase class II)